MPLFIARAPGYPEVALSAPQPSRRPGWARQVLALPPASVSGRRVLGLHRVSAHRAWVLRQGLASVHPGWVFCQALGRVHRDRG